MVERSSLPHCDIKEEGNGKSERKWRGRGRERGRGEEDRKGGTRERGRRGRGGEGRERRQDGIGEGEGGKGERKGDGAEHGTRNAKGHTSMTYTSEIYHNIPNNANSLSLSLQYMRLLGGTFPIQTMTRVLIMLKILRAAMVHASELSQIQWAM
jgi:hypothetical protein